MRRRWKKRAVPILVFMLAVLSLSSCGGSDAPDAETSRGADQTVQSAGSEPGQTTSLPGSLDVDEYDRLVDQLDDLPKRSVARLDRDERLQFPSPAAASEAIIEAVRNNDFAQADRILASLDEAGRAQLFIDVRQAGNDARHAARRGGGDYAEAYRFRYYHNRTANSPLLWRLDGEYLRGRVLDAQTGAPVPGAALNIQEPWSSRAQTDDDGRFELLMPAYPPLAVTIGHPDYKTEFVREDRQGLRLVPSELQGRVVDLELVPADPVERPDLPALTFRGRVVDAGSGEPLAGIPVMAGFEPIKGAPDVNLQIVMGKFGRETDVEGRFEITELPVQTIHVLAQGPHDGKLYLYEKADFTFEDGVEQVIEIEGRELRLKVPMIVVGTVRDGASREPVAGARVSAGGWKGERTDDNGRFMIQLDTGKDWQLTASHEAYHASPPKSFASPTPKTFETEFLLDPITTGTILGTAINAVTGEPIANAVIEIAGQRIRTDDSGRFRAEDVESGEITVSGAQSGYRTDSKALLLEALQTAEATLALQPITTGTITGIVVDASSGAPLAGAAVHAGGGSATTGEDGRFLLEEVEAGTIEVAAGKSLYVPESADVVLEAMATAETRMELEPITWGTVRGNVRDAADGSPLPGATVRIGALKVTTDDSGTFVAEQVPAGDVAIVAAMAKYHDAQSAFDLPRDGDVEQLLELAPVTTGTIHVEVRDATSGAPLPGAEILLGTRRETADADGRVVAAEVPAGRIVVNAGAELYEPGSAETVLEAASESRVGIELVPITYGTVHGTVVDKASGAPLADVSVRVGGQSLRSNADGEFRAERIPAGSVSVSAERPRYRGDQQTVALERGAEEEVHLRLDAITTGTVRGLVKNAADGRPVAGASVSVGSLSTTSDGDGRFEIENVGAGDAAVRAGAKLYEPGESGITVEAAGIVETEVVLKPITWGTVSGTVVDAETGRPLEGASVSAGRQSARTDASGQFQLERVAAGDVGVAAAKPVYVDGAASISLEAGQSETVELHLAPVTWGTVAGVVVDAETGRPLADTEVTLGTVSLRSDSDGRFRAEKVPAGSLQIGGRKAGYEATSVTAVLEPDSELSTTLALPAIRIGSIAGRVVDAKTGEAIAQARVTVGSKGAETDAAGGFRFGEIDTGRQVVAAKHPDYANGSASADVPPGDTVDVLIRLDLRREDVTSLEAELAKSGTIDLYGIYFDSGKAQFKPSSLSTLRAVLEVMKRAPDRRFRIAGHTDSDGGDDYNQALSERRANTVIRWLADNGIAAARLGGVGFGETRPAAPNDTESGKALNRRVQLSFAEGG